jgi:hypothetical protein
MLIEDRLQQTRLSDWYTLRQQLEKSFDPLNDVVNFFSKLPKAKFYTDPYDSSRWPTPWELIDENEYCKFNLILGICYTLQLTERFKNISPKIKLSIDNFNKTVYYLLVVDDKIYGYEDGWINAKDLPKSLKTQKIYAMKPLH